MALYDVSTSEKKASPELVAGGTLYADAPIGTIFATMSASPPSGFLMCDGTAYSATDYPELWAVLPSTVKDTTNNTFTIDLRETTLKGAGLTSETVGNHLDSDGLQLGEFLDDRVQVHEHYIGDTATPQHLGYNDREGQNAGIGNRTVDATIESDRKWIALQQSNVGIAKSGRYGATTEVKSRGVNFIIKAKMASVPADFLAKVGEVYQEKDLTQAVEGETTVEGALGALAIGKVPVAHEALTNNDCNTFAEGFHVFRTTGNSTNRPVTRIGLIYSFGYKTGVQLRLTQLYMSNDETPNDVIAYIRGARSSDSGETWIWGDWQRLATESVLNNYMYQNRTRTNDVLASALNTSNPTIFEGSGSSYTGDVPADGFKYATFIVIPRGGDRFVIGWINGSLAFTNYFSTTSTWRSWTQFSNDIYSTSETNTGKTWIDGKPIYRKVFTGLSIESASTEWHTFNANTPSDGDLLIDARVMRTDKVVCNTITVKINKTLGKFQYINPTVLATTGDIILVVEYTKTT